MSNETQVGVSMELALVNTGTETTADAKDSLYKGHLPCQLS